MTNAQIFKAAHKASKIAKNKFGGSYVVYMSFFLKKENRSLLNNSKKLECMIDGVELEACEHNGSKSIAVKVNGKYQTSAIVYNHRGRLVIDRIEKQCKFNLCDLIVSDRIAIARIIENFAV